MSQGSKGIRNSSLTEEAELFRIHKEFRTFELLDNELTKTTKDDVGFPGKLTQQLTERKERW